MISTSEGYGGKDSPVFAPNADAGSLASFEQSTDFWGCRYRSRLWSSHRDGESHRGENCEDGDELHGGWLLVGIGCERYYTGDHLVLGTGFWYDLKRLPCRQDGTRTLVNES